MRTSIYEVPERAMRCAVPKECVYRSETGGCDEPRINKGNSDAACWYMNNKDLIPLLSDFA